MTVTLLQIARLRLALTTSPIGATPVELADQETSLADCRIALHAARGIPLQYADPTSGRFIKEQQ
jgi:hypothetical protein